MFCRNCGNPVNDGDVACAKCGCFLSGIPHTEVVNPGDVSSCDKTVYLVLAILLGTLGVHNFYAGYTGRGVAQLLLTILSCFILSWAVFIWALVEGLTTECDAQGKKFKK